MRCADYENIEAYFVGYAWSADFDIYWLFHLYRVSDMMKLKEINYRNYICIAITLGFLACSVFLFSGALGRIIESGRDFGVSVAYYFCELFGIEHEIIPTVNELPQIPFFPPSTPVEPSLPSVPLPDTLEGFQADWTAYWALWASAENFVGYLITLCDGIEIVCRVIIIAVPFVICCVLLYRQSMKRQNNDYNQDTRPLRIWKKVIRHTYEPVKNWLLGFYGFLKAHSVYGYLWAVIWAYNFNAFTIALEFVAFYLYFIFSFDIVNIYRQVYKLAIDLTPMITFVPLAVWAVIGLAVFHYIRRRIGYARLNHNERRNCGFINERALSILCVGSMGTGKTTLLTSMCLSQEVMFRDKAFELLLECDMKFPAFPWINFENALKVAISKHMIYNLATCREFVRWLRLYFDTAKENVAMQKCFRRQIRKRTGANVGNLLFDYDYKRYGRTYDDKLKVIDVWEVMEDYAQLYFIYIMTSSIIISNYSIRSDMQIADVGNFPLWDGDFFHRDSRLIDSYSRHAHILDFDMLRLIKPLVANNEYRNAFEFGVVAVSEIGKERLNSKVVRSQGIKAQDNKTNQENDGFNYALKMARHRATVCNFPFLRIISDEQRAMSLGADDRELFDIVNIRERSENVLLMPFFSLEELLYDWVFGKFRTMYAGYRYNRGDNTLFMYLVKGIAARFNHYYKRTYNTFGCHCLKLQVESGSLEGNYKDRLYYVIDKKDYSQRFATDCFADFFREKALESPVGLNDIEEYETERARWEEMVKQGSYFIRTMSGIKEGDGEEEKKDPA